MAQSWTGTKLRVSALAGKVPPLHTWGTWWGEGHMRRPLVQPHVPNEGGIFQLRAMTH